jgi:hypothetical protein
MAIESGLDCSTVVSNIVLVRTSGMAFGISSCPYFPPIPEMFFDRCHGGRSRARVFASAAISTALTSVVLLALACGGDGSTSPGGTNQSQFFRIVAGGTLSDTVQSKPTQALVVEIRDSTGRLARGKTVRFEALPPDDPKRKFELAISMSSLVGNVFSTFVSDVADSLGRAKVLVAFGTYAGTARVRVTVPELGMSDTVAFAVKPGSPAKFIIGTRDTTVQLGATYSLNASLADRFSNPTPSVTPKFVAGPGIVSVSATGQVAVGTTITRGKIFLSFGTLTDSAFVTVITQLPLVGSRARGIGQSVVLVSTDGTGYSELANSTDVSLSPHAVKSTSSVVFYQGDPFRSATVSIVSPGSAARELVGPANGFTAAAWPRWSSDGAWVYFTGYRKNFTSAALWRIRPDGTQLDSLGTVTVSSTIYAAASISPDGTTAAIGDPTGVKLITVATKASRLIASACGDARYSPDGTRFACITGGALSVMNVDGSAFRQLSQSGQYQDLLGVDWSPDGNWLIASSTQFREPRLINVTDGSTIELTALGTLYLQVFFVR